MVSHSDPTNAAVVILEEATAVHPPFFGRPTIFYKLNQGLLLILNKKREFGNVMVIRKADLVTYKGPTMIASMLHAVAILLKEAKDWDWFLNLSASDYPLMSQDDMVLNVSECNFVMCPQIPERKADHYRSRLISFKEIWCILG
ncbi:Glycosyl transferase, family 14 [Corchorus olitorius]|uniref:Glycosyl transferase, family 14 n=1 Tax=Corchorus olitorius TaxID=93759 RepID=A0A1R3GVT5_9ROSI|nr:Glycosyl transferase, family 14 [Corchorus olitorius]